MHGGSRVWAHGAQKYPAVRFSANAHTRLRAGMQLEGCGAKEEAYGLNCSRREGVADESFDCSRLSVLSAFYTVSISSRILTFEQFN